MSVCRSCLEPIVWATTAEGNKMPLDAEPHEEGNVRLLEDGTCEVVGPLETLIAAGEGVRLHRSHFATCPEAAHWRGTTRAEVERVDG